MKVFDEGRQAGKRYSKTGNIDHCPYDFGTDKYAEWYNGVWFGRGEQAREDRLAMKDCPYASGSIAREYWEGGWKS